MHEGVVEGVGGNIVHLTFETFVKVKGLKARVGLVGTESGGDNIDCRMTRG